VNVLVFLLRLEEGTPPPAPTFEEVVTALLARSSPMSAGPGRIPTVNRVAIDPVAYWDEAQSLIGRDEAMRAARQQDVSRRHAFVYAHAALRLLLAQRLSVPAPSAVEFTTGPSGKPRLAGDPSAVHFSISYRNGWAALAVADTAVGIDVEPIRHDSDIEDIAQHVFTDDERAYLAGVPDGERRAAFYSLWTSKEALVKAAGVGIEHLAATSALRSPAALVDERGEARQYWVQELGSSADHKLAIALDISPAALTPASKTCR
jgi:4'-phosphopantetheinyl transferase